MDKARKQRNIVEFLEVNGGKVTYDWELRYSNSPPGPDWLHRLLGKDFFGHVHSVNLFQGGGPPRRSGSPALDNELIASAARLPKLKVFAFCEAQATDAGVACLADTQSLEGVILWGENFTDNCLQHFAELPSLKVLELVNSNLTDAGMHHVGRCVHLDCLYVDSPLISNKGLSHIKSLGELQSLFLLRSQITDTGLGHLKDLTRLNSVYIEGSHFSRDGIDAFKNAHSDANHIDLVAKP